MTSYISICISIGFGIGNGIRISISIGIGNGIRISISIGFVIGIGISIGRDIGIIFSYWYWY